MPLFDRDERKRYVQPGIEPETRSGHLTSLMWMYLIAADGEQDVLFRDLEARGEHGFEVSLVPVLPKTGHLAGAGHLHPEHHVGSGQARERKLGNLEDKVTHGQEERHANSEGK